VELTTTDSVRQETRTSGSWLNVKEKNIEKKNIFKRVADLQEGFWRKKHCILAAPNKKKKCHWL